MPLLSVIITAHNEGAEVRRTIEAVRTAARLSYEIILVDDGSTDGSCSALDAPDLKLLRHPDRIGVAASRNHGCEAASGSTFAFLDAHQRLSDGCLDECATVADKHQAIVWPDVRGFEEHGWTGHGAFLRLCSKHGFFVSEWQRRPPYGPVSRISMVVAPGYVMPRTIYRKVRWISALRGWGVSEPALAIKAFFLDIDLLHLCGPLTKHLFRKSFPYATSWESVWRNHALVARVCFDDRTWFDYWLPHVFDRHLSSTAREALESPSVVAEHEQFLSEKVRPDREFWRGLLQMKEPPCLKHNSHH